MQNAGVDMKKSKRYVEIDTLLERIEETAEGLADCNQQNAAWALRKYAVRDIREQPEADVLEAVHGRWIAVPSSDMMTGKAYKCSECKKMRYGSFMPNYCQNCGAKMDGRAENETDQR